MIRGKLYCVGVGPGDPELMTVKALRVMREADVIAYPHSDRDGVRAVALDIALAGCKEILNKDKLPVYVPMTGNRGEREEALNAAAAKLREIVESGCNIAYLVLGDPMIYGSYAMLGSLMKENGIETEYVPGVPSFCAAAARVSMPLAEGSETLRILPASGSIPALLDNETLVLMKAGSRIRELRDSGVLEGMHVKTVSNCGMAEEAVYDGVSAMPKAAGYFTVVMAKKR